MKSRDLAPILIIIVIVALVFGRSVGFDFINYDDPEYVTGNEIVRQGVTVAGVKWSFTEVGALNLWQPLTFLSHMLDVELFGAKKAGGHHLVNVLWHILGSVGLYLLLRSITGNPWLSLALAALWALHPQRIQSVAWISERKDVLAGAFLFWSWWAWERWRATSKTAWTRWYILALVLFLLGALSKPSVIPLPAIFLIRELLRHREAGARDQNNLLLSEIRLWVLRLFPFLAISTVIAALTIHFQAQGGMDLSEVMPLSQRLSLIPVNLWWYIKSSFWPFPGQLWVYPPENGAPWLEIIIGLTAFTALCWWMRARPFFLLGLAAFLLMWLPVSGVVPVSFYFVADRYAYFIQIGMVIMLAGLCQGLAARRLLIIPVLAASIITLLRLPVWQSSETLFTREISINPRSLLARIQLAAVKEEQADTLAALTLNQEALQIEPESGLAATNIGRISLSLGKLEDAEKSLVRAIHSKVLHKPTPYSILASIYAKQGRTDKAHSVLQEGLQRFPAHPTLLTDQGSIFLRFDRDPQKALGWYQQALDVQPFHREALQGKGLSLLRTGDKKLGIKTLKLLLEKHPDQKPIQKLLEHYKQHSTDP